MSALHGYRVRLHETVGDTFVLHFYCQAEDADHAEEQAENAYPGCEVLFTTLCGQNEEEAADTTTFQFSRWRHGGEVGHCQARMGSKATLSRAS
jgi:hypothetical protein